MLSQQLLVRHSQTVEYGKKDLENRLKEVVAVAMMLQILYKQRLEHNSVVQTSVEVNRVLPIMNRDFAPRVVIVCTSVARDRFN